MIVWNIKQCALEQGMSILELAKAAGVSYGDIYKIERGEKAPRFDTIWKIAKALNISIEELFTKT